MVQQLDIKESQPVFNFSGDLFILFAGGKVP